MSDDTLAKSSWILMDGWREPAAMARDVGDVPFVELREGRLQGVVSSGSDIERVYVSTIQSESHAYSCSTNNNRPCGGLRGSMCKHLDGLLEEAIAEFGVQRVARYLKVEDPDACTSLRDVSSRLRGQLNRAPSSEVFSRFLHHLRFVEFPMPEMEFPEMAWYSR